MVVYQEKENEMDTKLIETFRYQNNYVISCNIIIHCNVEKQLQLGTAKVKICQGDITTGAYNNIEVRHSI